MSWLPHLVPLGSKQLLRLYRLTLVGGGIIFLVVALNILWGALFRRFRLSQWIVGMVSAGFGVFALLQGLRLTARFRPYHLGAWIWIAALAGLLLAVFADAFRRQPTASPAKPKKK